MIDKVVISMGILPGCLAVLAGVFAISHAGAVEMYRWVDKNGAVHYSDVKPPAQQQRVESVQVRPTPPSDPSSAVPKSAEQLEGEYRARQTQRRQQDDKEKQAQHNNEEALRRCGQARGRLQDLEKARRLYTHDNKGERVYTSDEQRAVTIQQAKDNVEAACN